MARWWGFFRSALRGAIGGVLAGALIAALFAQSAANATPRGVDPEHAAVYAGERFGCVQLAQPRDFITFDRAVINDDYCDCLDGSDEPGTSACANGHFFCENRGGAKSAVIPSSFVNDGVCDCCDGSDEYEGRVACENRCAAEAAEARGEVERRIEMLRSALKTKRTGAELGQQLLDADRVKLEEIRNTELAGAIERHEKTKEQISRMREFERAADELDAGSPATEEPSSEDFAESASASESAGGLEEHASDDLEPCVFEDNPEDDKSSSEDAPDVDDDNGDDDMYEPYDPHAASDGRATEAEEAGDAINVAPMTIEQCISYAGEGDMARDSLSLLDRFSRMFKKPRAASTAAGESAQSEEDQRHRTLVNGKIARECLPLLEERERTHKRDIDTQNRRIEELEHSVAFPYGDPPVLRALKGKCVRQALGQYEFEHCPFETVLQYEHGRRIADLGKFEKLSMDSDSEEVTLHYEKGASCWKGPRRSVAVRLSCGADTAIVDVDEPSRCVYRMTFSTPLACSQRMLDELLPSPTAHDEL